MAEHTISIEGVDVVNVYGIKNVNIEKIKQYFPKLKIIARGNQVQVYGDEEEIVSFQEKMSLFLEHVEKFNVLSEQSIDNIMIDGEMPLRSESTPEGVIVYGNSGTPIKVRSATQMEMVKKIAENDLMFVTGPAGTGKTYVAVALAVRALKNRQVKRIILSRPAVEAEEKLGFLPGDMKDKLDPYMQPLYDALNDMIPAKKLEEMMRDKIVQIAPLAFMRGRTLGNAFVILDEAQNATTNQMKMFLTRMGENSKFIITGDVTQIDLPPKQKSGLIQSLQILKNVQGIAKIEFNKNEIIRHRLVRQIVDAFEKANNLNIVH